MNEQKSQIPFQELFGILNERRLNAKHMVWVKDI